MVVTLDDAVIVQSARKELVRGVRGMLERDLKIGSPPLTADAIVLGTTSQIRKALPALGELKKLADDGFLLKHASFDGHRYFIVAGANDRGVLYGTFALLRRIALHEPLDGLEVREEPHARIRFLNHWDNLDGTIERGYAGKSIFWENGHVTGNLRRVRDYARLMASWVSTGARSIT